MEANPMHGNPTRGVTMWVVAAVIVLGVACWASATAAERATSERFRLTRPTEIDGVPCAAGYVWRFADGRLAQCTLERAATVRNMRLPQGSVVAFKRDGANAFVFLPGPTAIEGHTCRGHGHDVQTVFHSNGRLALCWLEQDEMIQDVPCARTTFLGEVFGPPSGVTFAADGMLTGCRLSRTLTDDGRVFAKGSRVGYAPDGSLQPTRWGAEQQ
jgi:hypothetical protein